MKNERTRNQMFDPFAHQIGLRDFFLDGHNMAAHDPGTGKTFATLLACEADPLGGATLVGAPSVALGVWEREIEMTAPSRSVLILTAKTLPRLTEQAWDYVVVSLDLAARNYKLRKALIDHFHPERVVIDECHFMKGPDSKRTKVWLTDKTAIITKATRIRRWLLSGTPAPNHAGELWPLITSTDPGIIDGMNYAEFTERYCRHKMVKRGAAGRKQRVRVIAGTNLMRVKELRKRLDGWWQRVKKADVLTDLPDKMFRTVPIDIGRLDKSIGRLQESDEGMKLIEAIEGGSAVDLDEDEDSMSRFRSLLSEAKGKVAAEYVAELIAGGEPAVLLWFWHRAGMDVAQATLDTLGVTHCRMDGSTPPAKRRAIEERFQEPDGPQVFIGQIKAAGVSITLTRAAREVFSEASWNPGENWQAADRCHRIGQTRGVVVDFLAVRDTIDFAVLTTVERKTREIEELERGV